MDQFCTSCGHPLHPDERYCGACGHEAGAPVPVTAVAPTAPPGPWIGPPPVPTAAPPTSAGRGWWWVVIALVLAIAAVVVVAVVIWLTGDRAPTDVVVPAPVTSSTPSTTAPTTTTPTTAPSTVAPTTAAPPPFDPGPATSAFFVPEEALADWAWSTGLDYQGECASLSPTADYGPEPWCAVLWEDRGSVLVYRVADFPGGDFAFWVLVGTTDEGWVVQAAVDDQFGTPPF